MIHCFWLWHWDGFKTLKLSRLPSLFCGFIYYISVESIIRRKGRRKTFDLTDVWPEVDKKWNILSSAQYEPLWETEFCKASFEWRYTGEDIDSQFIDTNYRGTVPWKVNCQKVLEATGNTKSCSRDSSQNARWWEPQVDRGRWLACWNNWWSNPHPKWHPWVWT